MNRNFTIFFGILAVGLGIFLALQLGGDGHDLPHATHNNNVADGANRATKAVTRPAPAALPPKDDPDIVPCGADSENAPEPEPDEDAIYRQLYMRELHMRLIDDATGEPIASTKIQWIDLYSYQETKTSFDELDTDDSETETSVEGELSMEMWPYGEPPNTYCVENYPLPLGWLPLKDDSDEFSTTANARLKAGSIEPVVLRYKKGLTVKVQCNFDNNEPISGAEIRLFPLSGSITASLIPFNGYIDYHEKIREFADKPQLFINQSGNSLPEGIKYEFESEDTTEFPFITLQQWCGKSDKDGYIELVGMPSGTWVMCCVAAGASAQVREVIFDSDTEYEFSFPTPANLTINCKWHGDFEDETDLELKIPGLGKLYIDMNGKKEFSVSLKGLPPGKYDIVHWPTMPTYAVELASGENEVMLHFGPDSLATWEVDISVNGKSLRNFVITFVNKYSPRYDGSFDYIRRRYTFQHDLEDEPDVAEMVPGTYLVDMPNGETQEIIFEPGEKKEWQFDFEVREVEFSITEELAKIIRNSEGGLSITLDGEYYTVALDHPACIKDALALRQEESLSKLSSDNSVMLTLPPGVYGITFAAQNRMIVPFQLDLTDPNLTSVELTENGWPGTDTFLLKVGKGNDFSYMLKDVYSTYDSSNSFWIDGAGDVLTFLPPTEFIGHYFRDENFQGQFRIDKPGEYTLKNNDIIGPCSLSVYDLAEGEFELVAEVIWKRAGVTYHRWWAEFESMSELPLGPVKVQFTKTTDGQNPFRTDIYNYSTIELELTGKHTIKYTDLKWSKGARLTIVTESGIEADLDIIASLDTYRSYDACLESLTPTRELKKTTWVSKPIPDGTYPIFISIKGKPIYSRTVTITNGQNVTLDLR